MDELFLDDDDDVLPDFDNDEPMIDDEDDD